MNWLLLAPVLVHVQSSLFIVPLSRVEREVPSTVLSCVLCSVLFRRYSRLVAVGGDGVRERVRTPALPLELPLFCHVSLVYSSEFFLTFCLHPTLYYSILFYPLFHIAHQDIKFLLGNCEKSRWCGCYCCLLVLMKSRVLVCRCSLVLITCHCVSYYAEQKFLSSPFFSVIVRFMSISPCKEIVYRHPYHSSILV